MLLARVVGPVWGTRHAEGLDGRKVLELMGERPIAVVTVLRMVFAFSPVLNYALAMSTVRLREYVFGSLIGLIPWAVGCALATEWLLEWSGLASG